MGIIFDIIGSSIVRAAIVATILNLMVSLNEALFKKTDQAFLNEVIIAPSQTITNDLKLAGYSASKIFTIARREEMAFFADVDNNNIADLVRYYVSNGILYRSLNSERPFELARDVTNFTIVYFNVSGGQISYGLNRTNVKSIYVQLTIQSTQRYPSLFSGSSDSVYQSTTWNSHIFPLNL